jgi:hypothetical protein
MQELEKYFDCELMDPKSLSSEVRHLINNIRELKKYFGSEYTIGEKKKDLHKLSHSQLLTIFTLANLEESGEFFIRYVPYQETYDHFLQKFKFIRFTVCNEPRCKISDICSALYDYPFENEYGLECCAYCERDDKKTYCVEHAKKNLIEIDEHYFLCKKHVKVVNDSKNP